jgi:hypothetical protein
MIITRCFVLAFAACASSFAATAFELPKLPEVAFPEIALPPLPQLPDFPSFDFPDLPLPKLEEVFSIEIITLRIDDLARSNLSDRDYLAVHAVLLDVRERPLWWRDVALGAVVIGGGSAAAGGLCAQYTPISKIKAATLCVAVADVLSRNALSSVADLFGAELSQEALDLGASMGIEWGAEVALRTFEAIDETLADEWYYPAVKDLVVWSVGQLVN